MKEHPLSLEDRITIGLICWFVILLLFGWALNFSDLFLWIYLFVSAVLVFQFVLFSPESDYENHGSGDHRAPSETPLERITRLVQESEWETKLLNQACERHPELADELRDLYAQKAFAEKKEDST